MATTRDWHWTDEDGASPRQRRRTIRNWTNYKDTRGRWFPTDLKVRAAEPGDEFLGRPLSYVSVNAPIQFFVGDESATAGLPWWGVRKSDDGDSGIVMFVEGGGGWTSKAVDVASRSIRWDDVLPNTDLILYADDHKIDKWLALMTPTAGVGGTGDRAVLGFIMPAGWTLAVIDSGSAGNRIEIRRQNGEVAYRTKPAVAYDSAPEPRGVPCTFITPSPATNTIGGLTYWRVRVRCSPAGFTYPILMDPTVTISGATAVVDTYLQKNAADSNFGGATYTYAYNGVPNNARVGLVRIVSPADIPAGTITACRYSSVISNENPAGVIHRVEDANVWTEGRGTGAALAGESTWNQLSYGVPGAAWAGSAGCATSGVDYVAAAIGSFAAGPGGSTYVRRTWDIAASAPTHWRDSGISNGFRYSIPLTPANYVFMQSTEYADTSGRPYFEIDYTLAAPAPAYHVIDPSGRDGAVAKSIDPRGR
jgi:hypothetical protein